MTFRWILGAQCMGGNNVLGALKRAIEGLHLPSSGETGVYLITCASPDQPQVLVGGATLQTLLVGEGCNITNSASGGTGAALILV